MRVLMINAREWRTIAPLLPPPGCPGKPRLADRRMLSGLFYSAACGCSLDSLPAAYGNKSSLQSRRRRWTADGTLAKLMQASAPIVARMRAAYYGAIRDATLEASANDYRNSREFWGRGMMPKAPAHMRPRGRYAADRRR